MSWAETRASNCGASASRVGACIVDTSLAPVLYESETLRILSEELRHLCGACGGAWGSSAQSIHGQPQETSVIIYGASRRRLVAGFYPCAEQEREDMTPTPESARNHSKYRSVPPRRKR